MLPFLACSNVTIGILSVPSAAAYACSIAVCNLDDKTFPYIVITNETFPKVEIIRKKALNKDDNVYFLYLHIY